MSWHVVVLAQGDQKRLPDLRTPKQLLPLPACNNVPILNRTLRQVWDVHNRVMPAATSLTLAVVAWPTFRDHFEVHPVQVGTERIRPYVVTLPDPGNSSLKGFSRYWESPEGVACRRNAERTIMLLGDVVYSWNVLEALFDPKLDGVFAVSHDISPSTGELWGIAWNDIASNGMQAVLRAAMDKHPPQTVYQPGQMRMWLWEAETWLCEKGQCRYNTDSTEGDYTADIDLPKHMTPTFLNELSARAAADDLTRGVTW